MPKSKEFLTSSDSDSDSEVRRLLLCTKRVAKSNVHNDFFMMKLNKSYEISCLFFSKKRPDDAGMS